MVYVKKNCQVLERSRTGSHSVVTRLHKNILERSISCVILLPEKFLPFDWLRAEVFPLKVAYYSFIRVQEVYTIHVQI